MKMRTAPKRSRMANATHTKFVTYKFVVPRTRTQVRDRNASSQLCHRRQPPLTQPLNNLTVDAKHFAGSKVLRDSLDPSAAREAFIIEGPNKVTINCQVGSEQEADRIINGFRLICKAPELKS